MTGFLRTGYKLYTHKQTAFNAAMSHVIANAINGAYPDYDIDPSKVLVSRGSLAPADNGLITGTSSSITVSWNDNSGSGNAKVTDKALIAICNLIRGEAITDTAGAARSAGTQTLIPPSNWTEDEVHVYLGFISEDGKEVSNSVYLGSISIA